METLMHRSEKLDRWYEENLHLHRDDSGGFIEEHFEMHTESPQKFLSFQIPQLAPLISSLAESGIRIVDYIDENPRGKFAWIFDPEGNKVELWEPWDDSQSLVSFPEPD
ncbi:VOC family protein [Bdellovibrio sp. HCB209]|uniref:VOC family protein n=1 Tax=Bdellovibrio sp. HCB209 TaxID=3394354 RepID=UPI0039B5194C